VNSGKPGELYYQRKADVAYTELRARILAGVLAPSDRLNQEHLAADLGVSTTPLREALRRLESEGFVQMPAHRDVIIAPLDRGELISLYEVRESLDGLAAGQAATRHVDRDVERMQATLAALAEPGDGEPLELNRAFHAAIYEASHNDVLIQTLDSLWDRSDRYRRMIRSMARALPVIQEHDELMRAVVARDAERAERLMRAHVRAAREMIEREVLSMDQELS
jgi:DNA-binding GntR family transcriptional regulator